MNKKQAKQLVQLLPHPVHNWLKEQWYIHKYSPPLGRTRWGDLRRLKPISSQWGLDRGKPLDRYYIENFLARHAQDVHGQVLAIGDHFYTRKYGGDRVTQSDVLHVEEGNPNATIVGDLTDAPHIPSDSFDCFILTQTLQLIYEVRLALKTAHRVLKPGGVLLVTIPGITPLNDHEWNECWCWSFTTLSAQRLFEELFPAENIEIETFGNVLAATAFLQGLAAQEVQTDELDYCDPSYPVIITIRAVKPEVTS
jgi:SAM-dependent methyltransferase